MKYEDCFWNEWRDCREDVEAALGCIGIDTSDTSQWEVVPQLQSWPVGWPDKGNRLYACAWNIYGPYFVCSLRESRDRDNGGWFSASRLPVNVNGLEKELAVAVLGIIHEAASSEPHWPNVDGPLGGIEEYCAEAVCPATSAPLRKQLASLRLRAAGMREVVEDIEVKMEAKREEMELPEPQISGPAWLVVPMPMDGYERAAHRMAPMVHQWIRSISGGGTIANYYTIRDKLIVVLMEQEGDEADYDCSKNDARIIIEKMIDHGLLGDGIDGYTVSIPTGRQP